MKTFLTMAMTFAKSFVLKNFQSELHALGGGDAVNVQGEVEGEAVRVAQGRGAAARRAQVDQGTDNVTLKTKEAVMKWN